MSTETKERRSLQIKKAPTYCNILYNNDKTPMDIVIVLLCKVFKKTIPEAHKITMDIHNSDRGVAFIGSKEVCEFKRASMDDALFRLQEKHLKHNVEIYDES